MINGNTLNLYLISQTVNDDYDTFDSAVVAARDEEEAEERRNGGRVDLSLTMNGGDSTDE